MKREAKRDPIIWDERYLRTHVDVDNRYESCVPTNLTNTYKSLPKMGFPYVEELNVE